MLGLDDKVLLFYMDAPGDSISGHWQWDKHQWKNMWLSAFGTMHVRVDQANQDVERTEDNKIGGKASPPANENTKSNVFDGTLYYEDGKRIHLIRGMWI